MGWRATQLVGIQAIFFARLLILARLLDPESFGIVAIGMVALSVALRLSDMGMIPALVQRPDAQDREYDIAWTVGIMRACAVGFVLFVAAPLLAPAFREPRAVTIIQALALRPVIESFASIGVARLTRELRFRELAAIQLPGALADTLIAIGTAPFLGLWALVAGSLVGACTTTALSHRLAPHRPRLDFHFRAAAPLIRYGRWVLLTGLVVLAGSTTTQLTISREIGAAGLGLYFLAAKLAFLPNDAASSVIGAVAFPLYATHRADEGRSLAAFRSLLSAQAMVLLPVYGLMIALAPGIPEILGPRWAGTTPVVQILVLACVPGLFGEALAPVLMGRGQSQRVLVLELIQTGALLALLWPLVGRFGVSGAAIAWLVANALAQIPGLIFAHQMLRGFGRGIGPHLGAALAAGTASMVAASAIRQSLAGPAGFALALAGGLAAASVVFGIIQSYHDLRLAELMPWSERWAGNIQPGAPQ